MACVEKIKHDVDTCTSEKSLQVFYDDAKDKFTGYCFQCAAKGYPAYVDKPYGDSRPKPPAIKTKEQIKEELDEVRALAAPTFEHRGIPAKYFRSSGVRLALSEFDGKTPTSFNFPYSLGGQLIGFKTIMLDKKAMWSVGSIKGADLYDWEVAKRKASQGVRRLYCTEGEWDKHALEYMLETYAKSKASKYDKFAVVSLPHGAGSAVTTLGRMRKEIEQLFDQVVLVFDNDDVGQAAVKEVQKIMPSVLSAPYPTNSKDANEALLKGEGSLFADFCIWKCRKPAVEGVVDVSSVLTRALEPPKMGLSYPWASLTDLVYGQRFGEASAWGAGVGLGKCQGRDTPILMYDGTYKMAQDVAVGDLLMGDDSTPRSVRSTVVGKGDMFKVVPVKGETYTFNREHILAIYITNMNDRKYLLDADGVKHLVGSKSTITVDTYLRSSKKFKHSCKLYRVGVDFPSLDVAYEVPAYILGLWLGDGSTNAVAITTADLVVKDAWIEWGKSMGCSSRIEAGNNCETIYLRTDLGKLNPCLDALRAIGVFGNKHIPNKYLVGSKRVREQVLAGILDTDGSLHHCGFDITLKQEQLAKQVQFLSRSLGFYSNMYEVECGIKSTGFMGKYFRQNISGDVGKIPTKLKVADARKQVKSVLVTGFTIEPIGVDEYFGFDISGNRLYVLGDFTVTHNTLTAHEIAAHNIKEHGENVFMVLLEEQVHETLWNVSGKIDGIPYHKPEFAKQHWEQFISTAQSLEGKLFMWESESNTENRFDMEEIIKAIRFNSLEYGCKFHVIDNMTRLVDHLSSTEANEFINKWASEIANLATELDIHIDVYSHLNPSKDKNGRDHESGGEVRASQFTGSRGIMRAFPVMFGFERNKHSQDTSSNSYISCIKNRKYGGEGKIKTQYQPQTGRLLEYDWDGDSL